MPMAQDPSQLERLARSDWRLLAICAVVLIASATFGIAFFDRAFPEASIDFRFDRASSRELAVELLSRVGRAPGDRTHASKFEVDDAAKIFLERTLGLEAAVALMSDEVEVWAWTHRWFRPLDPEELVVRVSPRGEIVSFEHRIAEASAAAPIDPDLRVPVATKFLESIGVDTKALELVSVSDRSLPARTDSVLVWRHRSVRPGGAPYHYEVTLHGGEVGGFRQSLQVPEKWRREYTSLRAKNETAGDVASVLLVATTIAALFVFVIRARRRDIQVRYSAWVGGVSVVLLTLVSLNGFPSALAAYDTRTSFSSFLFQEIGFALLGGISSGLFLMVMVGAGDALLRERLPDKLAMPLLLSRRALRSKRVFTGSVLGFTLVGGFLAYQVAFYLIADRFGAWAPADIPYDETLNTLLPWAVVLFGGFFPAFSEEYISRAFSIPFLEKLVRRRFVAIAISALIWGFGHSAYPNQPFFIRGLEVGVAGVAIGYVVYRFGILPALVWHYTVDAIYTSLLLVQSGNAYYAVSSAICALIFLVPPFVSILLYLKHGGFEPDAPLENRVIGTAAPEAPSGRDEERPLPPPLTTPRRIVLAGAIAAPMAALLIVILPSTLDPVARYPMAAGEAIEMATTHLGFDESSRPERVVAFPSAGFRNWIDDPKGGSPGSYDIVAAEHIARGADHPFETLGRITRDDVPGATWKVRFFTPGVIEEFEVEIDPREGRVIGETRRIEEGAPGAVLERDAAAEIAADALGRLAIDPADLELKDAIALPMPDRRDWIFHYERARPIAPDAWMRVDVRLAGDQVVHIGRTVRIPEEVRREAGESTFVNSLLFFAGLAGVIFLLVVAGAGAVMAFRDGSIRWRWALRATALCAIPAAIAGFLPFGLAARAYQTSVGWDTFVGRRAILTFEGIAFQLFVAFLSLVTISLCVKWSTSIASRESRTRIGRDAVVRALVAAVIVWAVALAEDALELVTRVGLDVHSPVSDRVAIPLPALASAWEAIMISMWVTALSVAAVAYLERLHTAKARRWNELAIVLALSVFLADASARPVDLPVALVSALVAGFVLWLVAKHVLAPNPVSVPLTFLLFMVPDDIAPWIRSARPDLVVNAAVLAAFVIAAFVWVAPKASRARPAGSDPARL